MIVAGRVQACITVLVLFLALPLAAHDWPIPLLISDHHADHLEFFFRLTADAALTMLVLDAHADTTANDNYSLIRRYAAGGNFFRAAELAGNHNWIHPLKPQTLIWISRIQGFPRNDKLAGFSASLAQWGTETHAHALNLQELRFWYNAASADADGAAGALFVSVDLDFFYSEDHGPQDIPLVLDALFAFSSRWQGPVAWAFCLSRPWLPNDLYAWALLEESLLWLNSRPEFTAPQVTLFDSPRVDTSLNARAYRREGREIPAVREADMPCHIRELLRQLTERQ